MTRVIAGDIGGTHARFAIAEQGHDGTIALRAVTKLNVADHTSLQTAFEAFTATLEEPLPRRAGMAVAAPVEGELLKLTNNPWVIRPGMIAEHLALDDVLLINDFHAVAYAVSVVGPEDFSHLAGPVDLPRPGAVISLVGPGTGLGVAALVLDSPARVLATEGGHIGFAPLDSLEDMILTHLRAQFRRVSVERVVSGPGLAAIYGALAAIEGRAVVHREDVALWADALAGTDTLAEAALDRWMLSLGSVAGDLVLAHGAGALVMAGGMLPRVAHLLPQSGFHSRFMAKGRFAHRMSAIPIWQITSAEPGLLGAAAACLARA